MDGAGHIQTWIQVTQSPASLEDGAVILIDSPEPQEIRYKYLFLAPLSTHLNQLESLQRLTSAA